MKVYSRQKPLRAELERLRQRKKKIGFVPTMGALHEGHLSLIRKAKRENDVVVVSIFVNPTQFGPKEDFKKYPRPQSRDKQLLKKEKVDFLFMPSVKEMYSEGYSTIVTMDAKLSSMTKVLCGKSRPGHFEGVLTVVAKLFNVVNPHRVYFGQKDYQQAMVIRQMLADLNFDIQMRVCPIVRDNGGLALSSRNKYLSVAQRKSALAIHETLRWVKKAVSRPRKPSLSAIKSQARARLKGGGRRLDYLEIVDPESLKPLKRAQAKMVIACACFVGKTRLIDNAIIRAK